MSRNEEFQTGMAHIIAQNYWDPNMGTPESMVTREGNYVSQLAASSARDKPITLKRRENGRAVVWDGHHRLAAKIYYTAAGQLRDKPNENATVDYRWDNS